MPGTILRNTTGPFVSQPFLIPPGHSLALSLAGTSFNATLEATLDADSTDWVVIGPTFSATFLYNVPVGPVKFRLSLSSGTVVSAQYSSSLVQVQQVSTVFSTLSSAGQAAANLASEQARHGLSLSDFASFVVGGDWSLAWDAMMLVAASSPGIRVAINGQFTILSPLNVTVPVDFDGAMGEFLATGPNFLPDGGGNARPALNIKTTLGNGSFGDNAVFGQWARLSGTTPRMKRVGNNASFSDGSVGVGIVNAYYPLLTIGPVDDFNVGFKLTGEIAGLSSPSNVRGSSHGTYFLTQLSNHVNVLLESHGKLNSVLGGWVTTNNFHKGGFSSPNFLGANPQLGGETYAVWTARVIPDTHTHVVMIGDDIGWHYANLFHQPYFEGFAVRAMDCIGAMQQSGVVMNYGLGYEMPECDRRGNAYIRLRVNGAAGLPSSMVFQGGVAKERLTSGAALYTALNMSDYQGQREMFGSLMTVTPANMSGVIAPDSEWVLKNLLFQNKQATTFSAAFTAGTPLQLNLRTHRRFQINIPAGVSVPAGSVTFINPPTGTDVEVEVHVQQDVAGNVVDPAWLLNVAYKSTEAPVLRAFGDDTYYFRKTLFTTAWQMVTHATARPTNASTAPASLPTRTSVAYTGTAISLDLSTGARFQVNPTVNMPSGCVTFINGPSTGDMEVDILILQPTGGVSIDPRWLTESTKVLRYGNKPEARKRTFGQDTYVIRRENLGAGLSLAVRTHHSSNADPSQADLNTYAGPTLPVDFSFFHNSLEQFWKTDELQLYIFNAPNGNWKPATPTAAAALRGTVLKAAASSATATVTAGATPTKAEHDALLADFLDLKLKLQAAGILT